MTILNTGSTKKFSSNWEQIFSGRTSKKSAPAGKATASKKGAAKKSPAKKAAKAKSKK